MPSGNNRINQSLRNCGQSLEDRVWNLSLASHRFPHGFASLESWKVRLRKNIS